jgi:DNA-binding transcriptional MerR regulator
MEKMEKALPSIPVKRYFTIGEVAELCGVKPHVLRYWEQEFTQLRPMKRRGNRRYYQHHEVLMIRRIRDLLYDQGFTISGARNKLQELVASERERRKVGGGGNGNGEGPLEGVEAFEIDQEEFDAALHEEEDAQAQADAPVGAGAAPLHGNGRPSQLQQLRRELFEIRELLTLNR